MDNWKVKSQEWGCNYSKQREQYMHRFLHCKELGEFKKQDPERLECNHLEVGWGRCWQGTSCRL